MILGSIVGCGVIGLGHGSLRGTPISDTFVGATAPLWAPVMIVGIPVRAAYLSCSYLNPAKRKRD
jgi:hypothetical protein